MAICTLAKVGTRALRDLDLFRPVRDALASTLTSLDDAFSLKWESKAALPGGKPTILRDSTDQSAALNTTVATAAKEPKWTAIAHRGGAPHRRTTGPDHVAPVEFTPPLPSPA